MKTQKLLFAIIPALVSILLMSGCAGLNMNILEGKAENFKGVKSIYLKFDYSKMIVGRYDTEKDYIDHKVKELSETDRDEKWLDKWNDGKDNLYPESFAERFNIFIKDAGAEMSTENKDAKYTMVLKTLYLDLGFYAFVQARPAMINTEIYVFETANPSKVIFRCKTYNTIGDAIKDISRINEAYRNLGAHLGKKLGKEF